MIWIVFKIWLIFAITCAILAEFFEREFFGFLFLASFPLMFYVPFFLNQAKK